MTYERMDKMIDGKNTFLVLVKGNRLLVDEYVEKNGLTLKGASLTTDKAYGLIGTVPPTTKLERVYYNLFEAYKNTVVADAVFNVYIGNLEDATISELKSSGFDINEHNVLKIFTLDYDTYEIVKSIVYNSSNADAKVLCMVIMDYWPVIMLTPNASSGYDLDSVVRTHRFDYVQGTSKFHTRVPVPFDTLDDTFLQCNVLVDIKYNGRCEAFKYTVTLAGLYIIETDTTPTDKNIALLLVDSISWKYKLTRLFRLIKKGFIKC